MDLSSRRQMEPIADQPEQRGASALGALELGGEDACASTRPDCSACGLHDCPSLDHQATDSEHVYTGWRFAGISLGVFATPLLLALVGAAWFRGDHDQQLAGGFAGLCLGMILTALTSRLLHRESEV